MRRVVLLGVVGLALGVVVWFAYSPSDNSSVRTSGNSLQEPFPASPGEPRSRPPTKRTSAAPNHEPGPEAEPDGTESIEEKFRPLVEALRRAQARARQQEAATSTTQHRNDEENEGDRPKIWGIDKDGIQGAVRSAIPEIRECYEAWLNLNPSLQGKLTVSFKIESSEDNDASATVVDAKVKEGGVGNQFLDGCVVASLGSLQFDPPADGGTMNVTYPFTFKSADDTDE